MAKKRREEEVDAPSFDSNIIGALASDLNKEFKTSLGKIAYVGNEDSPSDISDWVSTGCDMLDLAISNRPNGGLPVGRIVELQGWSASGKSLLAAHICAETQKKGGIAVYIDTENAVSTDFFTAIGVDISKNWLYVPMSELENIFLTIEKIISKIRGQNTGQIVTIIVDSIMGATTKVEATSDYEKDGWATSKAIVLSKAMRKITGLIANEKILLVLTNQLRSKLGVSFGDNSSTSGGHAVGFHSSVRLRLKSKGQIKIKKTGPDTISGIQTEAKIIKNRLGPPHRAVDFDIYFDSGIDNYGSWLNTLKSYGIVKQAGAWYTLEAVNSDTGEVEEIKFQSKDFLTTLMDREGLKDIIYKAICDSYIMKYKANSEFGIDDIEITDTVEDEHE